jgi:sugar phosphate isomerase/epimerase
MSPDIGDSDVRAAGEAALAAGFTEASVWAHHIPSLHGLGLHIGVVEAAMSWANADGDAAAAEARRLARLAAEHGSAKIVAVCLEPAIADTDRARDNLAILVGAAEGVGAQVCVEFLPWSGIPDLATAWSLVEPLGAAAGILLDTWHWVRQPGGPAFELLAQIPGERIGYVQLCDAAPPTGVDLMTEAMTNRLLPGDGIVDFAAVFAALDAIGASPYIATEIFNGALVVERGATGAAIAMRNAAEGVAAGR